MTKIIRITTMIMLLAGYYITCLPISTNYLATPLEISLSLAEQDTCTKIYIYIHSLISAYANKKHAGLYDKYMLHAINNLNIEKTTVKKDHKIFMSAIKKSKTTDYDAIYRIMCVKAISKYLSVIIHTLILVDKHYKQEQKDISKSSPDVIISVGQGIKDLIVNQNIMLDTSNIDKVVKETQNTVSYLLKDNRIAFQRDKVCMHETLKSMLKVDCDISKKTLTVNVTDGVAFILFYSVISEDSVLMNWLRGYSIEVQSSLKNPISAYSAMYLNVPGIPESTRYKDASKRSSKVTLAGDLHINRTDPLVFNTIFNLHDDPFINQGLEKVEEVDEDDGIYFTANPIYDSIQPDQKDESYMIEDPIYDSLQPKQPESKEPQRTETPNKEEDEYHMVEDPIYDFVQIKKSEDKEPAKPKIPSKEEEPIYDFVQPKQPESKEPAKPKTPSKEEEPIYDFVQPKQSKNKEPQRTGQTSKEDEYHMIDNPIYGSIQTGQEKKKESAKPKTVSKDDEVYMIDNPIYDSIQASQPGSTNPQKTKTKTCTIL
ncbi:hypothetical protein NEOKW01_0742 [Nematocida sp. AWRm80]|nr:hypothetical protein NEOKW01_0742 [Nematocida sp. AWRm80]